MKTEKEVKSKLKEVEKDLKATQEQFELHDNYDDLEELGHLKREVVLLKWILSNK